ncbi:MAG: HisA/HisF-related TIM barrel protein [Actinomycetes bacterium]
MKLFPAVDLRGGQTVRLRKGDYGDEIQYDASPAEASRGFVADGAEVLHVVDLDGARSGRPEQLDVLASIRASIDVPIQYGGGLREIDDLRSAAAAGADRLVLGTAAVSDPALVARAVDEFGERIVASVDARDGFAATDGWTEASKEASSDLIERLAGIGVSSFVYSAIERDGTLEGPAVEEVVSIAQVIRGEFLYAGGIGSLEDLRVLAALDAPSLVGVIVGRALHENRFTATDAVAALAAG